MSVTLDGQRLFEGDESEIEPGSFSRDSVERAAPGLDGVLSIDLGGRSRKIRQSGVLRATSRSQMNERISAISAYMDGDTHVLVSGTGQEYDNLRMDALRVTKERTSGGSIAVDYEIVYTQLAV
ncbi:MAG TPA: hypothetical protein VMW16_04965 [Sedimentisphaerales bacterium]|nr:hypothetical protein [Sedimentisphaerales bacterium]